MNDVDDYDHNNGSLTMECKSFLFRYEPHTLCLSPSNSFSNSFIDFYSCGVVSSSDIRKTETVIKLLRLCFLNSEAREWRYDLDKTQTNELEWWMILKISSRAKAGVPKIRVKRKLRLHSFISLRTRLC